MVETTTDDSSTEQQVPDDYEPDYPPSPTVTGVEMCGKNINSPRKIEVSVKFWSHRGTIDSYEATVNFRVSNKTAELLDVEGNGRLTDQMSAIIIAVETVDEHDAVEDVRGLQNIHGAAMKYIGNFEKAEQEEDA